MKIAHNHHVWPCFVLLAGLLSGLLAGCGYYFPGGHTQAKDTWKNCVLRITGEGTDTNSQLKFLLRDRLQTRLGLSGQEPQVGESSQDKVVILKIELEPVVHSLVAEDRYGRADQYRITVRARPIVEGRQGAPTYPVVLASATYYEPYVSTSVQATRKRAEAEALERLADSLVAILSSDFQP